METTTSSDGVTIAFDRTGTGPSLIVVMGAFCDRKSSGELSAILASDFTVFEYDRRGRGGSGDGASYSIQDEVDDLEALLAIAGDSAYLYGHSSGAVLALQAAARAIPVRRILTYEPPLFWGSELDAAFPERLRSLAAAGKREEAAAQFMRFTGAPQEAVEAMKSSPDWPGMLAIAHTLAYDQTLCTIGSQSTQWLSAIAAPVRVVTGGDSPQWALDAANTIAETVPYADELTLPGQTHRVAPDAIAAALTDYFLPRD